MSEILVHSATPADAVHVARLNGYVHELHVAAEPYDFRPTNLAEVEAFFTFILNAPNHLVLLAEMGDQSVGYLWLEDQARPMSPFKNATRVLSLNHISVDPGHRRTGVGRALYTAAEVEARSRGIDRLVMDHWTFNSEAAAFFGTLGFESFNIRMRKHLQET